MSPPVGLGDLLRAWHATGCDPDMVAPLARVFSLEPEATASASSGNGPGIGVPPRPVRRDQEWRSADPTVTGLAAPGLVTELKALPPEPPSPLPSWLATRTLATPAPERLLEPPPLFAPDRERALLSAICRTQRPEGSVDTERIVDDLSRMHVPRQLPRLGVPSLNGGLQLIVDGSQWMAPFRADVARLLDRLRDVAGHLTEQLVVDTPPNIRAGEPDEIAPWTPPRQGTAIVIVSDLGRSALQQRRRAPRAGWVSFVTQIRAAGFSPLVLVPGRKSSYPDVDHELRHTLLLGWDRGARVAEAAHFRKDRVR